MRQFANQFGRLAKAARLAALLALTGCTDSSPPSVSGSSTEVTVHGAVKYKGQPVTDGTIQFDPANINRRDAKAVSAPIGKDGSYTVKTLAGENRVTFNVPAIARKDMSAGTAMAVYDAPTGDSTFDYDLSNPK